MHLDGLAGFDVPDQLLGRLLGLFDQLFCPAGLVLQPASRLAARRGYRKPVDRRLGLDVGFQFGRSIVDVEAFVGIDIEFADAIFQNLRDVFVGVQFAAVHPQPTMQPAAVEVVNVNAWNYLIDSNFLNHSGRKLPDTSVYIGQRWSSLIRRGFGVETGIGDYLSPALAQQKP